MYIVNFYYFVICLFVWLHSVLLKCETYTKGYVYIFYDAFQAETQNKTLEGVNKTLEGVSDVCGLVKEIHSTFVINQKGNHVC